MKYLLAITLILIPLACFAAVYMKTDPNGNVVYSDTPDENAQAITLPADSNNISIPQSSSSSRSGEAPNLPANTETATSADENTPAAPQGARKPYSAFTITDPTDKETFQNQRDIPITLKIEPALQESDKVQLLVDGIPAGDPSTDMQKLMIRQVDRGEHQVSAVLLDRADHVLMKADNVTIFIHYSAIPTGSGAISPVPSGGVSPSSPGSGIVPAPRATPTPTP
jgi:hypothetical protein